MISEKNDISVLLFNTRDELLRVELRKVLYFQADKNYTEVYFVNGYHVNLPSSMSQIEQLLNNNKLKGRITPFVRIGRSLIVNLRYILHIRTLKQELILGDLSCTKVARIPVAKNALKKLKELYTNKQ
ncbi:MAG: LytTR family DNA-binding domain-containing protein [Bacteroidales bacterium]|nr:LytTR family DNA-binding domain-containing protein [Bacteroidales bacterium]